MKPQTPTTKPVAAETSELVARRGLDPFEVPYMRGVHATYLLDVEGVGAWRLRVDDGVARLEEGRDGADCVIQGSDHDMALVMTGQQNLVTAVLQGRIKVGGNIALAQRFHGAVAARTSKQRRS